MFGFLNTVAARHTQKQFQFPAIAMNYPTPDLEVTSPDNATTIPLSSLTGLNASTDGIAVTARFSNTNWEYGAYERFVVIGNSTNYFFFQKRDSEGVFRWGYVANNVIIVVDQISINYLHDGMFNIGASVRPGRVDFCLNGYTIGYQTTNVALPNITDSDYLAIGHDLGGGLEVNSTVVFDNVKVWAAGLTTTELENATYEAEPLIGVTKQDNLYTVIKAGQSNSGGSSITTAPIGLAYINTDRMHMINKDLTLRPYADPYTTQAYGNALAAFDNTGGYSGAGIMLDNLAARYPTKEFAVMPCNRSGSGLIHNNGQGYWADYPTTLATNGNAKRTSAYALVTYLSMSIARQMGHVLAIEWYQGESDAVDAASLTATDYKQALTDLFDRWRLMLPPIRIIVNLSAAPASGFSNWATIRQALSEFTYDNTYGVDAVSLSTEASEAYHLDGDGQYDLGLMVADELKKHI